MKILYGTGNLAKLDAMRKIIKSYGFDVELYTIQEHDVCSFFNHSVLLFLFQSLKS